MSFADFYLPRTWHENPLVGTLVVDHVGKHSEILDTFARWGVILGTIFVYLVTFLPVRIPGAGKLRFGIRLAMLAAVTFTFGLNTGFASAGLMLYLMFPVAAHMLKSLESRRKIAIGGSVRA